MESINHVQLLTAGAFGHVFKGSFKMNREEAEAEVIPVAVKTIKSKSERWLAEKCLLVAPHPTIQAVSSKAHVQPVFNPVNQQCSALPPAAHQMMMLHALLTCGNMHCLHNGTCVLQKHQCYRDVVIDTTAHTIL